MSQATTQAREDGARDLLSLAVAPMSDLLAALDTEARSAPVREQDRRRMPSRALQISHLVVAETVRLIRVGTRPELSAAAVATTGMLARASGQRLADHHREAHRLLAGASVVLGAANSPASSAGELTVLRSWNGKASEAVALISQAPDYELPRARLRELLGIDESHMSHLLADLEASGLVVRRRFGREVTVYLGPTGHTDRVQERLPDVNVPTFDDGGGLVPDQQAFDVWTTLSVAGRPAETDDQVRVSNNLPDLVFTTTSEFQWRQGDYDNTDQDFLEQAGAGVSGSLLKGDALPDAAFRTPLAKRLGTRSASVRVPAVD